LDEPSVQIGVRSEVRSDTCFYVYTVLNRSRETLTAVQIGYDTERERCQLTGAPPHAPPDTALSPPGWDCAPLQTERDSTTFTVSWKLKPEVADSAGIAPNSMMSGFIVVLPRRDPLYEHCDWLTRFRLRPRAAHVGSLRPESELDFITDETGTISGRAIDEGGGGIPGVNVWVWRTDLSARTRSDGSYTIPEVPVGGTSVLARGRGFEPCARAHVRVSANATSRVDFRLAPMEPVRPCAPYVTATERVEIAFPGETIDAKSVRVLDRRTPLPAKRVGTWNPQAYAYDVDSRQISLVYQGTEQDTMRRAFEATVNRTFSSPEEERLLRIAEETYPPVEAVLSILDSRKSGDLSQEKRLWWYGDFDGVRLPYAVTMDAVRYYLGLLQAMGRGDSTATRGLRMKRASFSYHAHVSSLVSAYSRNGRVFHDVYIVEMGLKWSNYCGSLCACWFDLDRTVILRRDGTVLCVFGDRKPRVIVS
jgi:hypothetical protein